MTKTDNRWSPGASGAPAPDAFLAAYSARWIDQGWSRADVVGDRQGFAYDHQQYSVILQGELMKADPAQKVGELDLERDVTVELANVLLGESNTRFTIHARRAGGYIYVDAYLT